MHTGTYQPRLPRMQRVAAAAERPAPYLRVPDKLLRNFAHDPLAIGVYLAVARCALSMRGAAPLSPADLAAWWYGDRSRDLAVMRRIRRLIEDGWLLADGGRAVKLELLPTWGRSASGEVWPWRFDAPQQGKPAHVRVQRVPLALLDGYVGRIDPQPGRTPALVTRYVDAPLITLHDLGTYALATIARIEPSERLCAIGLFVDGLPQPPRPLVELAKTRPCDEAVKPTLCLTEHTADANGSANGSLNGSLNGSANGSDQTCLDEETSGASEREKCDGETTLALHAWDSWDSRIEGIPPNPPNGGGGRARRQSNSVSGQQPLDPASDAALASIGIRNRGALAEVPLPLIQAWQTAVQHPGLQQRIDDPPAFAYSQLRQHVPPPGMDELERWAQQASRRSSGIDPGRHYAPVDQIDVNEEQQLAQLVRHAQALIGSDADEMLLGYLVDALDAGHADATAMALAQAEYAQWQQLDSEEVDRVLRSRFPC